MNLAPPPQTIDLVGLHVVTSHEYRRKAAREPARRLLARVSAPETRRGTRLGVRRGTVRRPRHAPIGGPRPVPDSPWGLQPCRSIRMVVNRTPLPAPGSRPGSTMSPSPVEIPAPFTRRIASAVTRPGPVPVADPWLSGRQVACPPAVPAAHAAAARPTPHHFTQSLHRADLLASIPVVSPHCLPR